MTDLRGGYTPSRKTTTESRCIALKRMTFRLPADGGASSSGRTAGSSTGSPGPADAPEATPGSWVADETLERLEVTVGNRRRVVEVVSHQPDKLELRIGDAP